MKARMARPNGHHHKKPRIISTIQPGFPKTRWTACAPEWTGGELLRPRVEIVLSTNIAPTHCAGSKKNSASSKNSCSGFALPSIGPNSTSSWPSGAIARTLHNRSHSRNQKVMLKNGTMIEEISSRSIRCFGRLLLRRTPARLCGNFPYPLPLSARVPVLHFNFSVTATAAVSAAWPAASTA